MLNTAPKTDEEAGLFPSPLHHNHSYHTQQAAVDAVHQNAGDQEEMG